MKRIAVICDEWPHVADRFLVGYPRDGRWHKAGVEIGAVYAARPELAQKRAEEFHFRMCASAAEALKDAEAALLSSDAAVDRPIPVFRYGPVSPALVDASRKLKFPLMAGYAMQTTYRLPETELPRGAEVEEALMVSVGDREYEAAEAMQSQLERRKRGDAKVKSSRKVQGEEVWKAGFSMPLLSSALSRSDTPQGLSVKDGRPQDLVASGEVKRLAKNPTAWLIEYADGLKATLLMLDGAVNDSNFAAQVRGHGIMSAQFLMTPPPNYTSTALLMAQVEDFFLSGKPAWSVARSLAASDIVKGS